METQQSALDMANLNQEQYRQTKAINEAMKQIGAGISVEKVDDMMYVTDQWREHRWRTVQLTYL